MTFPPEGFPGEGQLAVTSNDTVLDVFGKPTTYVYDSRGNILTEIDPLGKRIDRTYDDNNNVWTETVITTELNAAGNPVEVRQTTEWTYDIKGNKLSKKDPL